MPIPTPHNDEDKNKFMSRCMSKLNSENQSRDEKWTHDQMIAICMSKQKKARATAAKKMKKKKEKWNG